MKVSLLLDFLLQYTWNASDRAAWIWAAVIFLLLFVVLGFFWGKAWNRKWGVTAHPRQALLSLLIAGLGAYGMLNYQSLSKVDQWLDNQRLSTTKLLSDSGRFNRRVLQYAWQKLESLGGQNGLTPPLDGGNEIRLNSQAEAELLASVAANEVDGELRTRPPYAWGLPPSTRPSSEVGIEAATAVGFDSSRFPVIVTPSNDWSKTAVMLQSDHAFDALLKTAYDDLMSLKTGCLALLVLLCVIQFLLIPITALSDIKENPKL